MSTLWTKLISEEFLRSTLIVYRTVSLWNWGPSSKRPCLGTWHICGNPQSSSGLRGCSILLPPLLGWSDCEGEAVLIFVHCLTSKDLAFPFKQMCCSLEHSLKNAYTISSYPGKCRVTMTWCRGYTVFGVWEGFISANVSGGSVFPTISTNPP